MGNTTRRVPFHSPRRQKIRDEYHTRAMLLGYKYMEASHTYTPTDSYSLYRLDPDTMAKIPSFGQNFTDRCDRVGAGEIPAFPEEPPEALTENE